MQSIEILRSRMLPSGRRPKKAEPLTSHEIAEYASAIAMLGGYQESGRLFSRIQSTSDPEILLLQAHSELAVFDYDRAQPLFERYLELIESPEDRQRAELRLLMCLMRGSKKNPDRADALLAQFFDGKSSKIPKPDRMYAGQMRVEFAYFFLKDSREALRLARQLEQAYPDHNSTGLMLWITLLSIRHGNQAPLQRSRIEAERKRAIQEGNGYGLRQFDLYQSFILEDALALQRYLFGTPYPEMRRLALERYGSPNSLPSSLIWSAGLPGEIFSKKSEKVRVFDVLLGTMEGSRAMLRPNDLPLTFLRTLTSDFYGRITEHEMHEKLYPGKDHVGPVSSQRLQTILHRLRTWLTRNSIPIHILNQDRTFQIQPTNKVHFRLYNPEGSKPFHDMMTPEARESLQSLRNEFSEGHPFSSQDFVAILKVSPRTVLYRLKELNEKGLISSEGKGPSRRYRLVSSRLK